MFINYKTKLIPLWKGISADELRHISPGLLDIRAINCDNLTFEEIAVEVMSCVRPDILSRVIARAKLNSEITNADIVFYDATNLKKSRRRREKLPRRDLSRTYVLYNIFSDVFECSIDTWIDNFCRDLNYEDELIYWEKVAGFYLG